jgi:hypothetical protein
MPFDLMDMNLPPEECVIYVFSVEYPEDGGRQQVDSKRQYVFLGLYVVTLQKAIFLFSVF